MTFDRPYLPDELWCHIVHSAFPSLGVLTLTTVDQHGQKLQQVLSSDEDLARSQMIPAPLLRINKLFLEEGRRILYTYQLRFDRFVSRGAIRKFFEMIGSQNRQLLKDVSIYSRALLLAHNRDTFYDQISKNMTLRRVRIEMRQSSGGILTYLESWLHLLDMVQNGILLELHIVWNKSPNSSRRHLEQDTGVLQALLANLGIVCTPVNEDSQILGPTLEITALPGAGPSICRFLEAAAPSTTAKLHSTHAELTNILTDALLVRRRAAEAAQWHWRRKLHLRKFEKVYILPGP